MLKVPANRLEDFDHIFADKLNDKGRNPFVMGTENTCEMSFANETVVMSCQKAIKQFPLAGGQVCCIDESWVVIDAIRD